MYVSKGKHLKNRHSFTEFAAVNIKVRYIVAHPGGKKLSPLKIQENEMILYKM